jgi:regulator of sirC expression with transglutaminase-like and TPR domain
MTDTAELNVLGYSITVGFSYIKGNTATLEEPDYPDELTIDYWHFTEEADAERLAEEIGLDVAEALESEYLEEAIMAALWDYIYSDEDYEEYDDYLDDSENLDWESCYTQRT